ncbi:MAG: transglutaminaseTgpA domain-containing protein [Acidobacteriota bacterium]|jgi:hypothetical protein|nr:transglutaminaseTgpA domain-containing protein [Acidobacteriota bacterium]
MATEQGLAGGWFKIASYAMTGAGAAAAAFAGVADALSLIGFAAALVASWFLDTARLRRKLPRRSFAIVAAACLGFASADYRWLSHSLPQALLHLLWLAIAARLLTRTCDRSWRAVYLFAALQWTPAWLSGGGLLGTGRGAASWICLGAFVAAGATALMLYEIRRPSEESARRLRASGANPGEQAGGRFQGRAFALAAGGIASAVLAGAIPLFFFFPRLSAGGAPATGPSVPDGAGGGAASTVELGRGDFADQSDAVVMRVRTDMPRERLPHDLKWRGLAFDHYDGRVWTLRRRAPQAVSTQGRFYKLEESALGSELLSQRFFVEPLPMDAVFAAHRALAVSLEVGTLRRDTAGNLFAPGVAKGAVNYVAVSDLVPPEAGNISDWTPAPPEVGAAYLQLPPLDPRIAELGRAVTQGREGRYAQARALEAWLRTRYTYALTPPGATAGGDPLAAFLFDARAGHCEYFATALVVMLRQVGVPARMASGYLAGDYNPVSGSWTVRRRHAHAWAEAWFPPYGWVAFDPTPPAPPGAVPARWQGLWANVADAAEFWWRENVASYDSARQYSLVSGFFEGVNRFEDRAGEWLSAAARRATAIGGRLPHPPATLAPLFTPALLAALAALLIRPLRRRLSGGARRLWGGLRERRPQDAATVFYAEALRLLESRGFVRRKAQTPVEFALDLGGRPAGAALADLTRLYNAARFGRPDAPFPRADAQRLLGALRAALGK